MGNAIRNVATSKNQSSEKSTRAISTFDKLRKRFDKALQKLKARFPEKRETALATAISKHVMAYDKHDSASTSATDGDVIASNTLQQNTAAEKAAVFVLATHKSFIIGNSEDNSVQIMGAIPIAD